MNAMKGKSRSANVIKFPCIKVRQGKIEFFLFKANAKTLNGLVKINRRDPIKDEGYQRLFSKSRINAISKYYESGKTIPLSILISFDKATINGNKIEIEKSVNAGWVIDGQHRLLGAANSSTDIEIPVIAFVKLPLEEQINQFITINREAKGVPSSLYIDLLKKLPKSKTAAEIAKERVANIVHLLNTNEESPFYGRIVILTSPKKGEISLTNFVRKAQAIITRDKGLLGPYDLNTQVKIFENYFNALKHVFVEEFERDIPIIYQTIGFGALMNVFPIVFTNTLATYKGFKLEDVIEVFRKIDHFDFDAWRQYGSGSHAENSAAKDMEAELLSVFKEPGKSNLIQV